MSHGKRRKTGYVPNVDESKGYRFGVKVRLVEGGVVSSSGEKECFSEEAGRSRNIGLRIGPCTVSSRLYESRHVV